MLTDSLSQAQRVPSYIGGHPSLGGTQLQHGGCTQEKKLGIAILVTVPWRQDQAAGGTKSPSLVPDVHVITEQRLNLHFLMARIIIRRNPQTVIHAQDHPQLIGVELPSFFLITLRSLLCGHPQISSHQSSRGEARQKPLPRAFLSTLPRDREGRTGPIVSRCLSHLDDLEFPQLPGQDTGFGQPPLHHCLF